MKFHGENYNFYFTYKTIINYLLKFVEKQKDFNVIEDVKKTWNYLITCQNDNWKFDEYNFAKIFATQKSLFLNMTRIPLKLLKIEFEWNLETIDNILILYKKLLELNEKQFDKKIESWKKFDKFRNLPVEIYNELKEYLTNEY